MIRSIAMLAILTLAACSESTGVPQVDRTRDAIQAEVGTTPAMRRLGDTAMNAARRAERAGETGGVREMGAAVTRGSVDVLCAGAGTRNDAAGALAAASANALPGEKAVADAADTVKRAAARLPNINPCRKRG